MIIRDWLATGDGVDDEQALVRSRIAMTVTMSTTTADTTIAGRATAGRATVLAGLSAGLSSSTT
jgi:hypothetical protein